jgi:superfamily II DNA or RNA helicase
MKFTPLDPELAYLGTSLYLPKKYVQEGPIRGALTFAGVGGEVRELVQSHAAHIEVPRAFLTPKEVRERMGLTLVDLRPKSYPESSLRPKAGLSLRPKQIPAWDAFDMAPQGVLQLPCGGGKTLMGLLKAASLYTRTLIISWQEAHLENWERELHEWFEMDGPVGWILGKKFEYENEVVFATIQTLARRAEEGKLPPDFHLAYGCTIYDEVHHLAAKHFSKTADLTIGPRFGLTATKNRVDMNEGIFLAHLGPIVYSDDTQELPVRVEVVATGTTVPENRVEEVTDKSGQRHLGLLRQFLAKDVKRNEFIRHKIDELLKEGRTIYVLSHAKEHPKELSAWYPNSGCITGDTPSAERLGELNNYPLVFATIGVGSENYNRKELDTILLLTPLAAYEHAAPAIQQITGRIQREHPGKKEPLLLIFLDEIDECRGLVFTLIKWAKKKGFKVKEDTWKKPRPKGW